MPKKSQLKNSKMIALGGGVIVVLGLLLVGTYSKNLTTQIGIFQGQGQQENIFESQDCIDAKNYLKITQDKFNLRCSAVILTFPHTPSRECIKARIILDDAEKNKDEVCRRPFQRPGDDEDGAFEPPLAPPPFELFASVSPTPYR